MSDATKLIERLRKFLDVAAGEGHVCGGIDAADLFYEIDLIEQQSARIAELESAQSSQQGAVEPYCYIYEYDGTFGLHREFARRPTRTVALYTHPHATGSEQRMGDAAREEQPSLTRPLTPYGMLVRALRIVADTTLYDMAKAIGSTPAALSAVEFGRKALTDAMVGDAAAFFSSRGIPDTLLGLDAARATSSTAEIERKGEGI